METEVKLSFYERDGCKYGYANQSWIETLIYDTSTLIILPDGECENFLKSDLLFYSRVVVM